MEGQPESDTGQPLQSLLFFKTLHVPLLVGWWPKSGSGRLPDPRDLGGAQPRHQGDLHHPHVQVSNPGALIINDELEPVAKEVARLEAEGVDIIIGLGHR